MTVVTKLASSSLFRYLLAGGTAFAVEYLIFLSLYALLGRLFLANSLSFLAGLAVSFSLQRIWAFKKNQFQKSVRHQFTLYGVLALFNLLIINALLGLLTHSGLGPRISKIAVMLATICWNFLLYRSVIFKPSSRKLSD